MASRRRRVGNVPGAAVSWVLVGIQGVLFAAIAFAPSSWGPPVNSYPTWGIALCVVGGVASLAAARALGRALTPLPEPNGAGMTAQGAYRWVRHPMYTAVMTGFVGVAAWRGAFVSWILVCVLVIFFELKTRREERFLRAAYPGYAAYAERTGKFVPRLDRKRT
jgi:protein-S-isoprenylcysteine O-methyltransferase Ste14